MGKLTARGVDSLARRKGRYGDGDGLFLRVLDPGRRVYWVYRYRANGRERETSLGAYPTVTLADARAKHIDMRKLVKDKVDPVGDRRKAMVAPPSGKPTFGQCADAYIRAHESGWRSAKHARQWSSTLTTHAASIRDVAVDQVDANAVRRLLEPIWNRTPETASRLRARIEAVLASAQVAGHIDADKPNPARWKGWLDHMLPNPRRLGERGHHAAMPYADVPEFVARLGGIDSAAARALRLTILCATRSGETLGARWDEISFETRVWSIEGKRMKMGRPFDIPLSDQALAILKTQHEARGRNEFIFPGRPMRPLGGMAMSMLLRRLRVDATVHGFRSSARSWMADNAVPFELAEACLAHTVGNAVVQAYQRSSMLERRRPIMSAWASFLSGEADDNVVPLRAARP